MATPPAQSARDHLKTTGGMGVFHKEWAAVPSVNTTPLIAGSGIRPTTAEPFVVVTVNTAEMLLPWDK